METKICQTCGKEKNVGDFAKNGFKRNGEQSYRPNCRHCEGHDKPKRAAMVTKVVKGTLYRKCAACNSYKPSTSEYFEGNRTMCLMCKAFANKQRRQRQKETDIVMYKCREMAWSAYARVFAKSKSYKKGYRHLVEPFGFSTPTEMKLYLYANFYADIKTLLDKGLVPSVDRKDTSIGYTPANIHILDFVENTELGVNTRKHPVSVSYPDGAIKNFSSVRQCADFFNTNDSHIRQWIKGTYKPLNKCKFAYTEAVK